MSNPVVGIFPLILRKQLLETLCTQHRPFSKWTREKIRPKSFLQPEHTASGCHRYIPAPQASDVEKRVRIHFAGVQSASGPTPLHSWGSRVRLEWGSADSGACWDVRQKKALGSFWAAGKEVRVEERDKRHLIIHSGASFQVLATVWCEKEPGPSGCYWRWLRSLHTGVMGLGGIFL